MICGIELKEKWTQRKCSINRLRNGVPSMQNEICELKCRHFELKLKPQLHSEFLEIEGIRSAVVISSLTLSCSNA